MTENFATNVAAQPEDQLKSPVQDLLRAVGSSFGLAVVSRTEAHYAQGRPDVGIAVGGLLCGYVELKAPGLGADPERLRGEQNKRQWAKFKSLPNLVYTDGNAWALYRTGERMGAQVRLPGSVTDDGENAIDEASASRLEALLRDFLYWEPIVPHSPKELAAYLTPLARLLREEVYEAASRPGSAIAVVAAQWRDRLFPHADDGQFADAYAQTLAYALLLARLSGARDLTPDRAADALDKGNGLLAETLRVLGHPDALKEVTLGFGPLQRALGALDPHDFAKRSPRDPWLYFYEDFLGAYDPKLRDDYGVYYTPPAVVRCQVRLISELLRERFGKRLSFADDGVTFLDPAVGTATYPLAAIDHALAIVLVLRFRQFVPDVSHRSQGRGQLRGNEVSNPVH